MIRKSVHIILAFMVLLSSTGFVIHKHFCQDELKNLTIFVQANGCHSNSTPQKSCPMHKGDQSEDEKKNCCKDISTFLKLDQNQEAQSFKILIQKTQLPFGFISITSRTVVPILDSFTTYYVNYKPPFLVCDFTVSLQTFLC